MCKILVTGGLGQLGREIHSIVKDSDSYVFTDITDNEFIVNFQNTLIDVYDYNNILFEMYSNPNSEFYNQKRFNENFNSIGIFIKLNAFNIFLSADLTCSS